MPPRVDKAFWQGIYDAGNPRFDVGAASPPLVDWLDANPSGPGRAVVPGCGYGHDVIELARRGLFAVGIDFVTDAIMSARAAAQRAGVAARAHFLDQDVFALSSEHDGGYDLLFEQTCYCAIDPSRRDEYAALAARLVAPGGLLLFVVYPADGHQGGPPFAIDPDEIGPRFDEEFELLRMGLPARTSKPTRADKEQFAVLRRRAAR